MTTEAQYQIKEALACLEDAANQIAAIDNDQFQMAYDVLAALLSNLKAADTDELEDWFDGPDEAQEWADYDPDC